MFGLLSQIAAVVEQHSNETDDDRAARLNSVADDLGVDPEPLYRAEEHLRDVLDVSDEDEEVADALGDLLSEAGGMAGVPIDGQQLLYATGLDYPALRSLLIQTATANATAIAPLVKLLHDLYDDAGLYDGMGYSSDLFRGSEFGGSQQIFSDIERTRVPRFVDDLEPDLPEMDDDVDDLSAMDDVDDLGEVSMRTDSSLGE